MSLFKYFRCSDPADRAFPKPDVVSQMPSSSIAAANKEVKAVLDSSKGSTSGDPEQSSKRGPYNVYSPSERHQKGKRAAKHGVTATIRYYSRKYPKKSFTKFAKRAIRENIFHEIREKWSLANFLSRKNFPLYGMYVYIIGTPFI